MMREMAVLSDIHGNIRALDAVLFDIARRGVGDIVNLGDCAYGPFDPRPVMDRLLELGLPTVSGNEDRIFGETASGTSYSRTATFCAKLLDHAHIEWLATLPLTLHVYDAFLFHGIPEDDSQYLLTVVEKCGAHPRNRLDIEQLLSEYSDPVLLCGHDHTPHIVNMTDGRLIVNPGSVGCPAYRDDNPFEHAIEVGSPHARYAVVEFQGGNISAELVNVAYDWDPAAQEARSNGFPDWATWIATGRAS